MATQRFIFCENMGESTAELSLWDSTKKYYIFLAKP